MNTEALLYKHDKILEVLSKWKILSLKGLYDELDLSSGFVAFRRKILRLEDKEILSSTIAPSGTKKFVFPTPKYFSLIYQNQSLQIDQATLFHDALVSNVSKSILKIPSFKNVTLPHEYSSERKSNICPDALFEFEVNKIEGVLALEIELIQKESERIKNKFLEYTFSRDINYALYVFPTERLLNIYKKRLEECIEETKDSTVKKILPQRIMLSLNSALEDETLDMGRSIVFFENRDNILKELFL